ncbi:MAG: carbon-nitrogen family hydrolase [Candidatus Heimdallarchaeota archaeon]|nr:carbon-nitrogen family hydrolase [Candidatus Heimdallarchaeota archaeon]
MKILLVQMDVVFGEPDINFQTLKTLVEQQTDPADIIIAPELFLTGYDRNSIESLDFYNSPYYTYLKEYCSQGCYFYGSVSEKADNRYYNTGVLIGPDGVLTTYRKSHLFKPMKEDSLFSPGRKVVTAKIGTLSIGLSICYDLRFAELYQKQAEKGIDLIVVVAEWPKVRIDHWLALLRARAIENQCFVIGVNRVGEDIVAKFGGHSVVYNPFGECTGILNHDEQDTLLVSIDISEIDKYRQLFDVQEDKWLRIP